MLSQHAPNLYAMLPDKWFAVLRPAGILTAMAIVGALVYAATLSSRRNPARLSSWWVALCPTFSMPFLLPQMHDRYFYLAEICAFIVAVLQPSTSTIIWALCLQLGLWIRVESFVFSGPRPPFRLLGIAYSVLGVWMWATWFAENRGNRSSGTVALTPDDEPVESSA